MTKFKNSNATFWVIFKQCGQVLLVFPLFDIIVKKTIFYGFWFLTVFLIKYSFWGSETAHFLVYSSKKASLLWMSFFFCLPTSKAMPSLAEKKSLWKKRQLFPGLWKKSGPKKEARNWLKVESLIVWRHAIYQSVLLL